MSTSKTTAPSDLLCIHGLRIPSLIGVNAEERISKQDLIFDIEFNTDVRAAADSDDLRKTIDYFTLKIFIVNFVSQSSYQLVETLAEKTADAIFHHFPINYLKLVITKKPQNMPDIDGVSIQIERNI